MDKVLTIVVPTYNMEKHLRKCLDSLIIDDKELFDKLEVLVVNDGSKDLSSAIAHEYQNNYPHVFRVIDKENGNYGSCVNRGLKEASGKYIKILDADDYFIKSNFGEFLSVLPLYDADLIISDTLQIDESGKVLRKETFDYPVNDIFPLDILSSSDDIIHMHSMTYRLKVLKDIGYTQTEGISYTDNEWSICPLLYMNNGLYIQKEVYCYFVGREGQTVSEEGLIKNRA